jgi:4a-hydroxytetrahydrobiopterin dehydratase
MSERLADQHCVPCQGGVPPLEGEKLQDLVLEVGRGWKVIDGHHLWKRFDFPDFVSALDFVNRVGALAEQEGHHPDLHLTWGRVDIEIWTHKIDGLTESDFILAARIEHL